MARSLYDGADSARTSSRINATPYQKTVIEIGGVDRSQGEQFPQISGSAFYCEAADYPVSMSFVDTQTNQTRTVQLRAGLCIRGNFAGVTITHPTILGGLTNPYRIAFYTFKDGADLTNEFASPVTGSGAATLISVNTAIALTGVFAAPPGARILRSAQISIAATTITEASWWLSGDNGSGVADFCFSPRIPLYTTSVPIGGTFDTATPITGRFKFSLRDVPVPILASGLGFNIVGTGIGSITVSGSGNGIVTEWA